MSDMLHAATHHLNVEIQQLRDAARELLKRYMAFIIDKESVSFVEYNPGYDVKLTEDEVRELELVESDIRRELRHV